MRLQLDENNMLTGYIVFSEFEDDGILYENELPDNFTKEYYKYKYENGKLIKTNIITEREKEKIRNLRKVECFSIVNRGGAWYKLLTAEMEEEFIKWYKEWLDATDTGVIPKRPTWLDAEGKIITD